ncbi:hypothetical protein DCO48_07045 [Pseudomonas sp. SDI]|uniref:carboxypeptidase regulatory-like domain-containing protein n=1 Tax=Pseudomonas sp. SDI TaxID=2170734 RepID=UPI000DE62023|nr:carboxypeptidase regulatory-like domain-containing protein [Pseudomonas sp. SDI]PWB34053.1 hypothetical protein DCO48_07045 [Pseudomonas sp. SDI]
MNFLRTRLIGSVTLALLLPYGPLLAEEYGADTPVDPTAVQLQPMEQNGISYLQGGIGLDESTALQQTTGYNLHISLSSGPENQYLSGASLVLQSASGQALLSLEDVGPLVYVKLPAGSYRVVASYDGVQTEQRVSITGKAVATANLHWR